MRGGEERGKGGVTWRNEGEGRRMRGKEEVEVCEQ